MSHKSQFIECDPRETEIIRTKHTFLVVIKLGRGQEVRRRIDIATAAQMIFPWTDTVKWLCGQNGGRNAMVYALGSAGGLETSALYGTYNAALGVWKWAEAADEARGV